MKFALIAPVIFLVAFAANIAFADIQSDYSRCLKENEISYFCLKIKIKAVYNSNFKNFVEANLANFGDECSVDDVVTEMFDRAGEILGYGLGPEKLVLDLSEIVYDELDGSTCADATDWNVIKGGHDRDDQWKWKWYGNYGEIDSHYKKHLSIGRPTFFSTNHTSTFFFNYDSTTQQPRGVVRTASGNNCFSDDNERAGFINIDPSGIDMNARTLANAIAMQLGVYMINFHGDECQSGYFLSTNATSWSPCAAYSVNLHYCLYKFYFHWPHTKPCSDVDCTTV